MDYLSEAIKSLRPGAQFAYYGDDYSTIIWHKLEGDAPTLQEIESEIEKIKANELKVAKNQAAAKTALLERLGITADEAALLVK